MQLYVTPFSPYGRMTRILLREKRLQHRVDERFAVTRKKDSPYYKINVSGRVPYFIASDGIGLNVKPLTLCHLML